MKRKQLEKASRKFDEDQVLAGIASFGTDLDSFYIYRKPEDSPGVIRYVDDVGRAWLHFYDGDEAFYYAMVKYLMNHGAPVFSSSQAEQAYEAELVAKKLSAIADLAVTKSQREGASPHTIGLQ